MKKLVVLLLCSGLLFPCFGQNESNSLLNELGVILAPGFSTVNGGESWSGTFGFQIGVETQVYAFNENSSLYVGLLFSMQGAAYEEDAITPYDYDYYGLKSVSDDMWTGKVALSYISIPVLFNYKWENGIYAEGGVQPGFLISAKDKPDGASSYDYKDYINTFDIGIPVGAGFWINNRFSVGARAVFGLTNINSDGTEMYSSDDTDRNFMVLGVARFKLNKK